MTSCPAADDVGLEDEAFDQSNEKDLGRTAEQVISPPSTATSPYVLASCHVGYDSIIFTRRTRNEPNQT